MEECLSHKAGELQGQATGGVRLDCHNTVSSLEKMAIDHYDNLLPF